MGVIWKVYWICCLLVIASGYFIGLTLSNPTPVPSPSPSPSPVPSVEPTDPTTQKTEKSTSDLELENQDQVAILKQINRVNEDGSYTFGYEAADGSFKIETRDVAGNVKGMFGFIDEQGELKRVSYSASNGTGFQSTGTLNIPPLPGTTPDDGTFRPVPSKLYQQIIRPIKKNQEESSTRIDLLEPTTRYPSSTEASTPRLPIYIYGTTTVENDVTSTARPVVIQHIPKVRPTPGSSTTEPTDSEEVTPKPVYGSYLPKKSSTPNYITLRTNDITSTEAPKTAEPGRKSNVIQVIRPRIGPYKKVIVTKRPIEVTTPKVVTTTDYYSKDYAERLRDDIGNGVRRQLPYDSNYITGPEFSGLAASGTEDSPDVYGGGPTARPYPAAAYRALFTQIPQHQRILQNSYIQNQNQYLAAAFNSGVPPAVPPIPPIPPNPNQVPVQAPQVPTPPQTPPPQNQFVPQANPEYERRLPVNPPQPPLPMQYPAQYPAPNLGALPANPNQPYNPQPYIPPALMEQLIRMILLAQQRRPISPFQQAVAATLGPGNIPPELLDNRYDPRGYYPYPNYSQVPYPYPPYPPRPNYDPRYMDPRAYPPPYPYGGLPYPDPRYQPGPYPPQPPLPYGPYQPQVPYGIDPRQQNEESFLLRMLLNARFPPPIPQEPNPQVQNDPNTVERSTAYGQRIQDSSTSPTTSKPRLSSVRNVQILDPINESTDNSGYIRNVKGAKSQ